MAKLKLFAFSRHAFDTREKALALLERLADGPFAPETFDRAEPVRRKLTRAEWPQAADMLRGAPDPPGGSLFLQSRKPRSIWTFAWYPNTAAQWYAEFDDALLARPGGRDKLVEFLAGLFREFPVLFAGVSPEEDWNARHWVTEEDEDGGETTTKLGLELGGCLPGVYWMTVFGEDLVAHFGADALRAAPGVQALDLQRGGLALVLESEDRGTWTSGADAVRKRLGDKHFFDISHPRRRCTPVPGVSDARPG